MAKITLCILALALAIFASAQDGPHSVPAAVINYSAQRNVRIHHNFFHNVRMSYLNIDAVQQKALEKIGWAPPRPAKAWRDGQEIVLNGDAGEDFLYMHRKMIARVNRISQEAGSNWRVVGWNNCPAPGDSVWPVPPAYEYPGNPGLGSFITLTKSTDYYWNVIKPAEDWLENPANLRTLTLGELGVKLEFELHTWFHLRFSAANSVGIRTQSPNPTAEIEETWDVPAYNYLADFYSAHVNPYFWKIHGWIENKINAWQVANGVSRIQWIGTWESGPLTDAIIPELYAIAAASPNNPSDSSDLLDSSDVEVDRDTLEEVIKLLLHAAQN